MPSNTVIILQASDMLNINKYIDSKEKIVVKFSKRYCKCGRAIKMLQYTAYAI